jgi:ADP-ribose pyrophosphatase
LKQDENHVHAGPFGLRVNGHAMRNKNLAQIPYHRTCNSSLAGAHMAKAIVKQPNKKARILKSEIIYEGKAFGVRRDELIEPTGVRTAREVVTHPGSVVVLPVLPDGRIVMVRQYRHATRQYLWELVAGRMEAGENPKQGARRELIEETGYRAKKFSVFLEVFPTPGFLEERMHILLAEGVSPGQAAPEEDEKILVAAYTRKELEQMMRTGKLKDAKTIAGLLFYFSFLA